MRISKRYSAVKKNPAKNPEERMQETSGPSHGPKQINAKYMNL